MVKTVAGHLVRLLVTCGLFGLVAVLSHLPLGPESVDEAGLRLALKTQAGTARICRALSAEELEALPIHMRTEETCFEFAVPYELTLKVDKETVVERRVRASGVRGDRPLVVGESIRLQPNEHRIELRFAPAPSPETEDPVEAENWRLALERAPTYRLDETLNFPAGRIVLLALDEGEGRVVVR